MSESALDRTVVDVTPEMLEKWLESGEAILVDVREDFEYATEHIEGAHHAALSKFDPQSIRRTLGDKRLVFCCRTGRRSTDAALRCANGDEQVFHLAGGVEGWKKAGRPIERSAAAPRVDVMRQVQMTAGSLVVIGVVLGVLLSPWFLILSAFVGCGLVFAGASGWCGMAKLLALMPWNSRAIRS